MLTQVSLGGDGGALPNLVVIGAMKCGTSALHRYLNCHPAIAMSEPKELNFFFGPEARTTDRATVDYETGGNWHRGVDWYMRHFRPEAPLRGESSPGYTSPAEPGVAERMHALVPEARLVYLVRDPVDRALSQYRHHRAEGAETRPLEQALLDPDSQYVARGHYHERLRPFLGRFARDQIAIVAREELLDRRRATLRSLFGWLGVADDFWSRDLDRLWHTSGGRAPRLDGALRDALAEVLVDDADRLRALAGRDFPRWAL
jgi:hypothetical protein